MQLIIFTVIALIAGFALAWGLQANANNKIKKELKSIQGFLESERLMKETLQKENNHVHLMKQINEAELNKKLNEANATIKQMDEDILLLQKSNEETEEQLLNSQPALHELKLKLIEANNTIARFKGQTSIK